MNSTATGSRFEEKVFAFLKREIANGRLPFRPENCKIFRQQPYYSKDRESNIVFDIAIEIYRPGSTSYSVLMLIECKNYSHAVPVNDAEEFAEKIRQVGGSKGIIVSTGPFQQGTVNYCKSKHIGLVRHLHKKFDWTLERARFLGTQLSWMEIHGGLLSSSHGNYHPDLYCCIGNAYAIALDPLVREMVSDVADVASILKPIDEPRCSPRRLIDFISKEEIERASATALEAVGYSGGEAPLEKICQWQSAETGLIVRKEVSLDTDDESTQATLGRIRFDPLEITTFHHPNSHPCREKFTLAHELGHHFLGHSKYMTGEYCEEDDFEVDAPDDFANVGLADIRAMEWQANYFASSLLLPRESLLADFERLANQFDLRRKGSCYLYLDEQPCNRDDYRRVTNRLRLEYSVSSSVVRIRLQALGLLIDARKKTGWHNNPFNLFS